MCEITQKEFDEMEEASRRYTKRQDCRENKWTFLREKSDYESHLYQRVFPGRTTKLRYDILKRWERTNVKVERCHHEWDCCGCLCGIRKNVIFEGGKIIITINYQYNY